MQSRTEDLGRPLDNDPMTTGRSLSLACEISWWSTSKDSRGGRLQDY